MIQRYGQFEFFWKGSGNSVYTIFYVCFSKKMFHVTFYQLAKFSCLIAFTCGDIGQYVCYTCDLIKFEINLIFLIKSFWYITKTSRQNLKNLENKKLLRWSKNQFFIIFKGLSVAKNCLRPESVSLRRKLYKIFHGWISHFFIYGVSQKNFT